MKKTAYHKDILRTITRGKKRFCSIMIIAALGVVTFTGLRAACVDLRKSADVFLDEQNLYDIMVQSTLGLTDDDVEALSALEGVSAAEGGYSAEVYLSGDEDTHARVLVKTLSTSGMNEPYIVEGTLPAAADEIAVTKGYLADSGKSIGDTVTIEEIEDDDDAEDEDDEADAEDDTAEEEADAEDDSAEDEADAEDADSDADDSEYEIDVDIDTSALEEEDDPTFLVTTFTITASVTDPADINNPDSGTAFRISSSTDYTFFVLPEAVDTDIYTSVYITVDGAMKLDCYSDAYSDAIEEVVDRIEQEIKEDREAARTEEVRKEAQEKIDDAEETMADAFAQVDEQIADAEEELADGREELDDGWEQYYDGLAEAEDGQDELDEAKQTLTDEEESAEKQIAKAREEIEENKTALAEALAEIEENEAELEEGQAELDAASEELAENEAALTAARTTLENSKTELNSTISELETQLTQLKSQVSDWPDDEFDALRAAAAEAAAAEQEAESSDTAADGSTSVTVETMEAEAAGSKAVGSVETMAAAAAGSETSISIETMASAGSSTSDLSSLEEALTAALTSALQEQIDALEAQIAALKAAGQDTTEAEAALTSIEELIVGAVSLAEGLGQTDAALSQITAQESTLAAQESALDEAKETLSESQAELTAGAKELAEARKQIEDGQTELEEGEKELDEQEAEAAEQFAEARKTINESQQELTDAFADLADALEDLEEGEQEYADGLQELADGISTYETERADAEAELADAKADLADLDDAVWYVQDRTSLSGYANIESDSGAIEAIGNAFPIVFLAVAILISLTTITRMVEEERGLIGTAKALGFTDAEIRRKYLIFALSACAAGGLIGTAAGFIVLPEIVFIIFQTMYSLPRYLLSFDPLYGLIGPALFLVGVGIATWRACRSALKKMPAVLMRPKTPKAGSRVFLERISFIWRRLSFLNKVTARNLFRYKKRLFMTVIGIMGCTALLMCGFAIKDTVTELMPRQYEQVYRYDLLTVADDNDELLDILDNSAEVSDYLNVRADTVTVEYEGSRMSVQLYVVADEDAENFSSYINLTDTKGNTVSLASADDTSAAAEDAGDADETAAAADTNDADGTNNANEAEDTADSEESEAAAAAEDTADSEDSEDGAAVGILITRNAGQILGFSAGDTISVQDLALDGGEVQVSALLQNYLGNSIYMTQSQYEQIFGEYEANGAFAHLSEDCTDTIAWADELSQEDCITSAVATQQLQEEFSEAFVLINMVVYIIIFLAGALAFVVLFTLSATNISERERELATIKVLGFYDREVHLYVNKETLILTILGILPGLPLGAALGHAMTAVLNMPSLYFAVCIYPVSYVLACAITVIFALLVQLITNRTLDGIDPVEALKSIE